MEVSRLKTEFLILFSRPAFETRRRFRIERQLLQRLFVRAKLRVDRLEGPPLAQLGVGGLGLGRRVAPVADVDADLRGRVVTQ